MVHIPVSLCLVNQPAATFDCVFTPGVAEDESIAQPQLRIINARHASSAMLIAAQVLRTANLILSMASKARGHVLFAAARKSYCFGLIIHAHQYKSLPKQTRTRLDTLVSQLNAQRFTHRIARVTSHPIITTRLFPITHPPLPNSRLAPPSRHSSSPHKAACSPTLQLATTPPPRLCILPHLSHPIVPLWQSSLRTRLPTRPAPCSRRRLSCPAALIGWSPCKLDGGSLPGALSCGNA
ncbi:hypothetical protein IQ07DRAFT_277901 [Pyrenochaeta sp. DS3sAY3a]|nr:hypothetical protein IQ07DRAFT_277901 [Pyrenochaeta sp. DS3sAY3a]